MENQVVTVNEDVIENLMDWFEKAAQTNEYGAEFWYARDLQKLLGYAKWDNFEQVINKAIFSCENSDISVNEHFQEVFPEVGKNPEGGRPSKDFELSRYACYLIAQNGDPRKEEIAFAQTYFAIQTRKQELIEQEFKNLSEDKKRVYLRNEMKEHNKNLASVVKKAGVVTHYDYANFQNAGYIGLYGGLDKNKIQAKKGLEKNKEILDHMGSTELAANLFRATQTEEKLVRDNIKGKINANQTHFEVGKKVRQTIAEIGGAMPENLPIAEDVKKIERRLKKEAIEA
jgi:DNA-damage-inducible protein D